MSSTVRPVTKTPPWAKALAVVVVLALLGGAAVGGVALGRHLGAGEERDTQVIRSISREEQVILMTAGVADVKEERGDGLSVFGLFEVPGSERALFLRYEYDAKFGVEGGDVDIAPNGENSYLVTIPEFRFLGYDNPDISVASEQNGILSWTTPEIDQTEVIEAVLTDEAVEKVLAGARPVLEEQARTFYRNIITSIDPAIALEFEFTD